MKNISVNEVNYSNNYKRVNNSPNFKAKIGIQGVPIEGLMEYIKRPEFIEHYCAKDAITATKLYDFQQFLNFIKKLPDDIILMFDKDCKKITNLRNGLEYSPDSIPLFSDNKFFNYLLGVMEKATGYRASSSPAETFLYFNNSNGEKTFFDVFNTFKKDIVVDGTQKPEELLKEAIAKMDKTKERFEPKRSISTCSSSGSSSYSSLEAKLINLITDGLD